MVKTYSDNLPVAYRSGPPAHSKGTLEFLHLYVYVSSFLLLAALWILANSPAREHAAMFTNWVSTRSLGLSREASRLRRFQIAKSKDEVKNAEDSFPASLLPLRLSEA